MSSKSFKIIGLWCILWFLLIDNGCRNSANNQLNQTKVGPSPVSSPVLLPPSRSTVYGTSIVIDVPKFAYKSPAEFEQVFGQATEIKAVKGDSHHQPGEYRLYRTPNHPQGLSVHFYGGRALIFNLVLNEPAKSPSEALAGYFAINLEGATPIEKTQFLEKWQGKFNKINFTSVYAMKERVERDDYKLLHAEVGK